MDTTRKTRQRTLLIVAAAVLLGAVGGTLTTSKRTSTSGKDRPAAAINHEERKVGSRLPTVPALSTGVQKERVESNPQAPGYDPARAWRALGIRANALWANEQEDAAWAAPMQKALSDQIAVDIEKAQLALTVSAECRRSTCRISLDGDEFARKKGQILLQYVPLATIFEPGDGAGTIDYFYVVFGKDERLPNDWRTAYQSKRPAWLAMRREEATANKYPDWFPAVPAE